MSSRVLKLIQVKLSNHMSDRQNPNCKMRFRVKVIVFGSSLYRFTMFPATIKKITFQMHARTLFTATRQVLQRLSLLCVFSSCAPVLWLIVLRLWHKDPRGLVPELVAIGLEIDP